MMRGPRKSRNYEILSFSYFLSNKIIFLSSIKKLIHEFEDKEKFHLQCFALFRCCSCCTREAHFYDSYYRVAALSLLFSLIFSP